MTIREKTNNKQNTTILFTPEFNPSETCNPCLALNYLDRKSIYVSGWILGFPEGLLTNLQKNIHQIQEILRSLWVIHKYNFVKNIIIMTKLYIPEKFIRFIEKQQVISIDLLVEKVKVSRRTASAEQTAQDTIKYLRSLLLFCSC